MAGALRWREARPGDVPALFALIQSAYRGEGGWTSEVGLLTGERIGMGALRERIARADAVLMVVDGDRGPVACCEVSVPAGGDGGGGGGGDGDGGECAHLGLFAVDPACQGGGVGRRLVAAARTLAEQRFGAGTLEIQVVSGQPALLAWYERLGFAATGETVPFPVKPDDLPLVAGLHFVVMRCPTRPSACALSWSGGKDSVLALRALTADGAPGPVALVTTVTAEYARISMHGVRRELLRAQAGAVGVTLVEVEIPVGADNACYEERLAAVLARPPLDTVAELAFGDLFLADIRSYREAQCAAAGRRARFPLWGRDTTALAQRFVALGFRARLTCVDPARLDPGYAGREFDERLLAELPAGVDPCGENGEFHTFVYDGPGFSAPIGCALGEVVERDGFVFADLVPA